MKKKEIKRTLKKVIKIIIILFVIYFVYVGSSTNTALKTALLKDLCKKDESNVVYNVKEKFSDYVVKVYNNGTNGKGYVIFPDWKLASFLNFGTVTRCEILVDSNGVVQFADMFYWD